MVTPRKPSKMRIREIIVRELQTLARDKEQRKNLEIEPWGELKGREHWVLHLLVKALDDQSNRNDELFTNIYETEVGYYQNVNQRFELLKSEINNITDKVRNELVESEWRITQQIDKGITERMGSISTNLISSVDRSLNEVSKVLKEQVDEIGALSKSLTNDVNDTYKIATQVRLTLTQMQQKLGEMSSDILALEESIKKDLKSSDEEIAKGIHLKISEVDTVTKDQTKKIDTEILDLLNKFDIGIKSINKHLDVIDKNVTMRMDDVERKLMAQIDAKTRELDDKIMEIKTAIEAQKILIDTLKTISMR